MIETKISGIRVCIRANMTMPTPAFFSPFAHLDKAAAGDLIAIERGRPPEDTFQITDLSNSRTLRREANGLAWRGLVDDFSKEDQVRLKNSLSFARAHAHFADTATHVVPSIPVLMLNECLVARHQGGFTCLVREGASSHDHLRLLANLQILLPDWLAHPPAE